jgi:hypothetical protein
MDIAQLHHDMQTTYQFKDMNMLQHGLSVHQEYLTLLQNIDR